MNAAGFTSLVLRAVTLASKFLLIVALAKYLEPSELGIFGLIGVTVALTIYIAGFEFYAYNTRELLKRDDNEKPKLIKDQLVFHLFSYLFVFPLLLLVFVYEWLPWEYLGWFYLLSILEHLSQESYRLLITLSRPIEANIVLFCRSGAWVYVIIGMIVFIDATRDLDFILGGWLIGVTLSLLLTGKYLSCYNWAGVFKQPVDRYWVRQGIRVSLVFFFAVLSIKIMEFSDRYFIRYFFDDSHVGVYTFFANIANVVQTFVYAGVISIIFPKLIQAYQNKNYQEYRQLLKNMALLSIMGVAIVSVLIVLFVSPVLTFIGKEVYVNNLQVLWIMIGTMGVIVIGFLPHYGLYVRSMDTAILLASVLASIVAILMNVILVPRYGLVGAASSTLIGATTLITAKYALLLMNSRNSVQVAHQSDV